MIRCDNTNMPKIVQKVEFDCSGLMFELILFDETMVYLDAGNFGIGLMQRTITPETFVDVEEWCLRHIDWYRKKVA